MNTARCFHISKGMCKGSRALVRAAALVVIFLTIALPVVAADPPATYGEMLDKRFSDSQTTDVGQDQNQMTAEQAKLQDLENGIKEQTRQMAQPPPPPVPPPTPEEISQARSSIAFKLLLGLGIGALVLLIVRMLDWRDWAEAKTIESRLKKVESDPSVEAFFAELRNAMGDANGQSTVPAGANESDAALAVFLESAARKFANFRALLAEIVRVHEVSGSEKQIAALIEQTATLKESSNIAALHPVYLMACGLDGLIRQLSRKNSEFNASAWRTIATAADVMEALCLKRLNPNLATDPPAQILAVDDDPISRRAVSFALEKVFNKPTLAQDGEAALVLADKHAYDVIFLDVDMPGMDGFEVCTKIHETAANRSTPVVFVTRHSDFESRAKSALIGGHDLIGKPFLSFEITVKALTLILANRSGFAPRQSKSAATEAPAARAPVEGVKPEPKVEEPTQPSAQTENGSKPLETPWRKELAATETTTQGAEKSENSIDDRGRCDSPDARGAGPKTLPDTFSAWSPAYLETLRDQIQAAMLCTEPEQLHELVTGLYLAVHSFAVESERADMKTIHRLSSALEGMLKKVMEKPELCAPSVWSCALAALELLGDLPSKSESRSDFNEASQRILVVDDDPVACRAVSGAIQLVFGKPIKAGDGETALAIASKKALDLIFLDVLMPGMDGFVTCSEIHETELNSNTPIVFITNHDSPDVREKAALSGGCGLIPKPVFSSQITLVALTSILRFHLNKIKGDTIIVAQRDLVCEPAL